MSARNKGSGKILKRSYRNISSASESALDKSIEPTKKSKQCLNKYPRNRKAVSKQTDERSDSEDRISSSNSNAEKGRDNCDSQSKINDTNCSSSYFNAFVGSGKITQELPKSCTKIVGESRNVVHYLSSVAQATSSCILKQRVLVNFSTNKLSQLKFCGKYTTFNRRVTSIAICPTPPYAFAVAASKGGDLLLYNTKKKFDLVESRIGVGPGGSVVGLKFHPTIPNCVYTAAVTGKVECRDFLKVRDKIILETGTQTNWFSALDIDLERDVLLTGDCRGYMYLASEKSSKILHKKKFHSSKVNHVEFCTKSPNMFLTASVDRTVKVWDIRKLPDKDSSSLAILTHDSCINSACFNPSCSSLLTTDQNNELRVYSTSGWKLDYVISHPHRHFQHLTPIKASWHPWNDAIVVGRYPDDAFRNHDKKTIDFYDGYTGTELYRLHSEMVPGITSLNVFNADGDIMMSGSGYRVVFWQLKEDDLDDSISSDDEDSTEIVNRNLIGRPRAPSARPLIDKGAKHLKKK